MVPIKLEVMQKYLNSLLTTEDVCELFGRSDMTLNIWRMKHGLPYFNIPGRGRPAIRYDLDLVLEWAEKEGKEVCEQVALQLRKAG